jgi:hypothetical protein
MEPAEELIHQAIYVYDDEPPPHGIPHAVSLCPKGRTGSERVSEVPARVTCFSCRLHMKQLGLRKS